MKEETEMKQKKDEMALRREQLKLEDESGGQTEKTSPNARTAFASTEAVAATDGSSVPVPSSPYGFVSQVFTV